MGTPQGYLSVIASKGGSFHEGIEVGAWHRHVGGDDVGGAFGRGRLPRRGQLRVSLVARLSFGVLAVSDPVCTRVQDRGANRLRNGLGEAGGTVHADRL